MNVIANVLLQADVRVGARLLGKVKLEQREVAFALEWKAQLKQAAHQPIEKVEGKVCVMKEAARTTELEPRFT